MTDIASADAAAQAAFAAQANAGRYPARLWLLLNSDLAIGLQESERQAMLATIAKAGNAAAIYAAACDAQGAARIPWERVNPVRQAAFEAFAAALKA